MNVLSHITNPEEPNKIEVVMHRKLRLDTFTRQLADAYNEKYGGIDQIGVPFEKTRFCMPELFPPKDGFAYMAIGGKEIPYFAVYGPGNGADYRFTVQIVNQELIEPNISMDKMRKSLDAHLDHC